MKRNITRILERFQHIQEDLSEAQTALQGGDEDSYRSRLKNIYMAVSVTLADENMMERVNRESRKRSKRQ